MHSLLSKLSMRPRLLTVIVQRTGHREKLVECDAFVGIPFGKSARNALTKQVAMKSAMGFG